MGSSMLQRKLLPLLDFLVHDWLDISELLARAPYREYDRAAIDDLLSAAADIAADWYEPANAVIDQEEPRLVDGHVTVPQQTCDAWDAYVRFGFTRLTPDVEHGGMQVPNLADFATKVVFTAASIGISPALLTEANAALLLEYGNRAQRDVFAAHQLAGRWTGTMCLSESHAGSTLAYITTRAVADGPDSESDPLGPRYRIFGDKMWISGGDHDLTENIVHLVLAEIRAEGDPQDTGTSGISLFVVPKVLVDLEGRLTERNDVVVSGLNHKLGFRGLPNTALAFGDGSWRPGGEAGAIAYLVGEPGEGLQQMFHMMNAARILVGLGAAALGFAGFAASLEYARQRTQGHALGSRERGPQVQVPIVEHPDVKQMLLAQKAYAEGGIALGLLTGRLLDVRRTGSEADAEEASLLLDVLTPIAKSWPSEWCLQANNLAIQVLGGAGYTRDFPVEQYWRDNRLNMIHEGTHGIQALDLLGRKVRLDSGARLVALARRVRATAALAERAGFEVEGAALADAWRRVESATATAWSTDDPRDALPNATQYLRAFGHVVVAWVWLEVAVCAAAGTHAEAPGKVAAMKYFFAFELPKVAAWLEVIERSDHLCRDLDHEIL